MKNIYIYNKIDSRLRGNDNAKKVHEGEVSSRAQWNGAEGSVFILQIPRFRSTPLGMT